MDAISWEQQRTVKFPTTYSLSGNAITRSSTSFSSSTAVSSEYPPEIHKRIPPQMRDPARHSFWHILGALNRNNETRPVINHITSKPFLLHTRVRDIQLTSTGAIGAPDLKEKTCTTSTIVFTGARKCTVSHDIIRRKMQRRKRETQSMQSTTITHHDRDSDRIARFLLLSVLPGLSIHEVSPPSYFGQLTILRSRTLYGTFKCESPPAGDAARRLNWHTPGRLKRIETFLD